MMTRLCFLFALLLLHAPAQTSQERLAEVQQKLRNPDAAAISQLLAQAAADPDPAIRRHILDRLSRLDNPDIAEALRRHAASDPDADVALTALERLRFLEARRLGALFEQRLALAAAGQDEKALETLRAQHQRWRTHARGAVLPAFLHEPPPLFKAVSSKNNVRVVAIADFGLENQDQRAVFAAVAAAHRRRPFNLGITLGDNIVPDGVTDPSDPRWKGGWEQIYDSLGIPFFPSAGNHDWGLADSPAAQILYSQRSKTWRMPALYYTFTAGPAQFFALDTFAFSHTQAQWLRRHLDAAAARWKIVYGHHPIYSYGVHGDTPELQRLLLPVLRRRAQLFLAGHDHLPQHLKPEDGLHFFVSPAAGQSSRADKSGPLTLFSGSFHGFITLEIDPRQIKLAFLDIDGKTRYQTAITQ